MIDWVTKAELNKLLYKHVEITDRDGNVRDGWLLTWGNYYNLVPLESKTGVHWVYQATQIVKIKIVKDQVIK